MGELYLIFFAVGVLLFAVIVAYSVVQKRKAQPLEKQDYVDPLFAELEQSKTSINNNADALSEPHDDASDSVSDEQAAELNIEASKTAPTMEPSTAEAPTIEAPTIDAPTIDPKLPLDTSEVNVNSDSQKKAPSLDEGQSVSGESIDTTSSTSGAEPQSATVHQVNSAPKPQFDEKSSSVVTELVARIKNDAAIEQQGLLSLFRKHDFKFQRQVHIFGLNQLTDMWRDIEFELPSARFTELGVSIQLADRDGAMSQKELHDFQQMVLEFTDFYDAPFEFSMEIDDALKQALALDQIGRRYDSMAVLNVVPKSKAGFRIADIESCARDLMMSTDKNGIFMKTIGSKNNISVLFRLACTDGTGQFGVTAGASTPVHDLVVYMNVPATSDPESVFQEMVRDANSLATWLEGKVVDRNGRVMTQRSYSVLMQQVSDIAFSMQQDGFTPGDAVAKKLF